MSSEKTEASLFAMTAETSASRVAFSYESMAFAAHAILTPHRLDVPSRNAFVDSFVVHSRRLLAFFIDDPTHATDLVVADVVGSVPEISLEVVAAERINMNRRVLHLTTDQTTDLVTWPVSGMAKELREAFESLVHQMAHEESDHLPRFEEALNQIPGFEKLTR